MKEAVTTPGVATPDRDAPPRATARRGLPRLLPIADSYLMWRVAGAALHGLMWFAGLFLLFAIATGAKKIAQDHVPFMVGVEGILLQMPRIVLFTIPASLLYGTVQTFVDMSSKGEVTALLAGGMSLPRMLRMPLAFALVSAIFAFWLQESIVPTAEFKKGQLLAKAIQNAGVQEGFFIVDKRSDGSIERIMQAASFDPKNRVLIKPVIQMLRPDFTVETEIKADRAIWDTNKKVWHFYKAEAKVNTNDTGPDKAYSVPMSYNEVEVNYGPNPEEMKNSVRSLTDNLQEGNFEMVSWKDLKAYRSVLKRLPNPDDKRINAATYGIHDKFATPLVCLAMVLIGAPLGIRPQRTAAAGLALGMSLVVLILYYLVWTICTQVGKGGAGTPLIVAYLPFVLTAGIGAVLVKQKS
jgi:lipopolysaccharide export system permease protein